MKAHRIATLADIERIESAPYAEFIPHASVYEALAASAQRHAGRIALSFVEAADAPERTRHWSYAEFIEELHRAANLFQSLAGDEAPRVALLLPSIPQACFALWGAEAAGVACPINYLLDSEHVASLIRATGANILVALGPNPELDIWSRVDGLREQCPGLRHVLAVGGLQAPAGALHFDTEMAAQNGKGLDLPRPLEAAMLAALFHTGGTTGAPKLAQHTHGNQLHAAWSAAQMYAMDERDVILNGFPIFHVAGTLVFGLSTLLSGAQWLLPTLLGLRNRSFVPRYWDVVERHAVSLLAAVPTVISTLLGVAPGSARIGSVRALLTGGSPLPPELATAFEQRYGIPVRNILGMTECAGVVSIEPFLAGRKAGSCGLRLPYTQVQALGFDGLTVCAAGQPGVLRLRGPNVGPGYTDAARNAGTFDTGGWLSTGDIGHVDSDGCIFITGRAKDLIIRSGHNIEPGVIEDALMRHPEVAFAAAVGAPDEYAGEVPVAFVVLKPGASADEAALLHFLSQHIAEPPAQARRIEVLDALPTTAVGKIYKPVLRLRAMERVINERLAAAGLSQGVRALGQEGASGLSLTLSTRHGTAQADVDAAVRALMAAFAIRWSWAT